MSIRAVRGLVSLLAGVAIVISACSSSTAQPGATPAASQQAPAPGPLRVAFAALGNESLDPLVSDISNKVYLTLVYDWLVDIDRQSNLDPKRSVAESSELSADKKVHTYKIRKGVKFQDGSDLTSADVKFSLERITQPTSKTSYAANLRDQIAKIEAPDSNTVIITTKNPSIFLDYDLSPLTGNEGTIVPKAYIEKNGDAYFAAHPIGSGPYRYVDSKNGDFMNLTAFDGYWKFKTTYKDIQFKVVPEESTRAALLQRGDADIISASARKADELEKAGFKKVAKAGDVVVALPYAQWLPPFNDARVREALNLAVDRKAINDSLYNGAGTITANYPVNSSDLGYKPEPLYQYDPERAKALLKESGVPTPKVIAWSYERAGLEAPRLMQALAGMWQAVGFQVETRASDYAVLSGLAQKDQVPGGSVGLLLVGGRLVGNGLLAAVIGTKSVFSISRDPKTDQLIAAVNGSTDVAGYKAAMGQAADWTRQNHIFIPILETGAIYATRSTIPKWDLTKTVLSADLLNLVEKR